MADAVRRTAFLHAHPLTRTPLTCTAPGRLRFTPQTFFRRKRPIPLVTDALWLVPVYYAAAAVRTVYFQAVHHALQAHRRIVLIAFAPRTLALHLAVTVTRACFAVTLLFLRARRLRATAHQQHR